ncbi:MAG: phenylalanine--tRNA ligase subunit alpha [Candidatus Roizmanbacteria bacterium]|nr:phenylalanine--tRNA ligase subunit alpha [Candidatus Roizmanbacteria bacterium]
MDIQALKKTLLDDLSKLSSTRAVSELELSYLGRNGKINDLLKGIKNLSLEEKKTAGKDINTFKAFVTEEVQKAKDILYIKEEQKIKVDVTLPPPLKKSGSLHPITIAVNEITGIFNKIGFIRMSYPEVDWEYYAFEVLNMPKTHAARDDFETTFLNGSPDKKMGKMVLTPHTSNGQVREMERLKSTPPIRMINIGKCYRPNWDATHTPMFHQFEGLCVDKGITIANLKGTLEYFVKSYFGENTEVRLRPHHFQFTEPSFEVDITCTMCKGTAVLEGKKCKICKSGWLELGGTGMVHPNVLKAGGIDPTIYSGWAFGFGIERVNMMKYGIDDIRNYYTGDIRFLKLF